MATRRTVAVVALVLLALLASTATPSEAWWRGGGRVYVGVGFGPWWYPGPYYYPYPAYAYPYPGYAYPAYTAPAPEAYVEREAAPAPPAPEASWYYCPSARQYYPSAPSCPEAWVKVPARPQ